MPLSMHGLNKYIAEYGVNEFNVKLKQQSHAVWEENGKVVTYLKHRYINSPRYTPVDMDEFLIIKLKSTVL